MKVLIVDDSAVMRKMVTRGLRQAGYVFKEVLEAGNGSEAIKVLNEHKVDLIMLDWNMPVMNGLEFIKVARQAKLKTPIVMLTTEGGDEQIAEAMAAGASGYLTKPFTAEKLKSRIDIVLDVAA
jgi:two-component system, chemotaxis family, chemotaxis protein CheY